MAEIARKYTCSRVLAEVVYSIDFEQSLNAHSVKHHPAMTGSAIVDSGVGLRSGRGPILNRMSRMQ